MPLSRETRAASVEERLSQLPADRRAHVIANSRWLPIYAWRAWVAHPQAPGGGFTVNKEFYNGLVEFLEDHRGIYFTPITANHDHRPGPPEREGALPDSAKNFGRVITLRETEAGIEAYVYFARGLAQDYDDGLIDSISPTHYNGFQSTHNGKHYTTGLKEVSIVRIRHQKGLRGASPWYQLDEQELSAVALTEIEEQTIMHNQPAPAPAQPAQPAPQNAAPAQPAPLTNEIVQGMINSAITSAVTPLSEQIQTLIAQTKPGKPTANTEPPTTEVQLAEMQAQLKLYEARDKVRSALPGADDKTVTALAESVMLAPHNFEVLIAPHKELATLKTQPKPTPGQVALTETAPAGGYTPNGGTPGTVTRAQAYEAARKANIPAGVDTVRWVRQHYPNAT